jgi:hypothetical protein
MYRTYGDMISIEYIAGLFDGEGTVGIYKVTNGESEKIYWSITLNISGSFRPVLEAIQAFFGFGSIYSSKRNKKLIATRYGSLDTSLCKQGWRWEIRNKNDSKEFLSKILPHLHEKKEQVELTLAFIDGKIAGPEASLQCKALKKFNFTKEDNLEIKLHTDLAGCKSPCAKFNEENLKDIRTRLEYGEMQSSIAKSYNTNRSVIWKIKHGLSYPSHT